jgi:hypothetical protein
VETEVAGSIATGHVTSDSFKYPCQEGRGAMQVAGNALGEAARESSVAKAVASLWTAGIAKGAARASVRRRARSWDLRPSS